MKNANYTFMISIDDYHEAKQIIRPNFFNH